MEDKRTALAIVLSMIVVLMWSQTFMSHQTPPTPSVTTSEGQTGQGSLASPAGGAQLSTPSSSATGAPARHRVR